MLRGIGGCVGCILCQQRLKLYECKPLPQVQAVGGAEPQGRREGGVPGRGSHSSTSELNLSALCGIGGARRDCVARVKGV